MRKKKWWICNSWKLIRVTWQQWRWVRCTVHPVPWGARVPIQDSGAVTSMGQEFIGIRFSLSLSPFSNNVSFFSWSTITYSSFSQLLFYYSIFIISITLPPSKAKTEKSRVYNPRQNSPQLIASPAFLPSSSAAIPGAQHKGMARSETDFCSEDMIFDRVLLELVRDTFVQWATCSC